MGSASSTAFNDSAPMKKLPDVRCLSGDFNKPSFGFRQSLQDGPIISVRGEQQAVGFGVLGHKFIERQVGERDRLVGILIGSTNI